MSGEKVTESFQGDGQGGGNNRPVRGHRQGTRLADGRWKTVRGSGGQRREFYQRSGESKRQLHDRADRWAYEAKDGDRAQLRLSRAIELYLEHRAGEQIADSTRKTDAVAARLIASCLGSVQVGSLDPVAIDIALRQWAGKPRTAKKARDFGRKLYRWMEARGWVKRNPFSLSRPVNYQPDSFQEPISQEHFEKALACVADPQMRAMFLVLRWTGIRPVSVRELKWFEVQEGEFTHIVKRKAKTAAGRQPILVPEPARSALLALPKSSEYVFPSRRGGHWSANWADRGWRKCQLKAGLAPRPLYDLKHMRASELVEAMGTALAARAIGIASEQVLNRHYVQVEKRKLDARVAQVGDKIG